MNQRLLVFLCFLCASPIARAESDEDDGDSESNPQTELAVKSRSSTSQAERWLNSPNDDERENALERLGLASDAQGVELLIGAVQPNGQARTPRLRLVALRSLAHFLKDAAVRRALVTLMSGAGQAPEAAADPMEVLVREEAAMALARSGSADALTVLGKSLRQGGPTGLAAAQALTAYPPQQLRVLLTTPSAASTKLVDVLAAIKDQRAFNALRSYVTRGNPEVRARATIALTDLGHLETIPLARHWLANDADEVQRLAAVQVLSMTRTEDSAKYLAELLDDDEHAAFAVRLALDMPDRRLLPALGQALNEVPNALRPFVLAAVARAGGARAARILAPEVERSDPSAAVYALALTPAREARDVLSSCLNHSKTQRACARGLSIRAAALGDEAPELESTLQKLLASSDAADRAAGAFGLSALSAESTAELVASKDSVIVLAAARNADRGRGAEAAARRLSIESDPTLALALSNALNDADACKLVPSSKLYQLVQSGSAAASLAARALGARLAGPSEQFIDELRLSQSPQIRAEFALGLAEAPAPAATGLLWRAYEFETNPLVRRAIIAAASQRPEHSRARVIQLARALDPDEQVRQLAALAANGHPLARVPTGTQTFWLTLDHTDPKRFGPALRDESAYIPVVVQGPRGHTRVGLADPDGFVGFVGMDQGPLRYLLADAPN